MKIRKIINYNLRFENGTTSDFYLASTLYKYILEKSPHLDDYIGFDSEDNPKGIHDFLYSVDGSDKKTLEEIESNINKFLKDFELVKNILEKQCDEDLIDNNLDFYDQFKKLSKALKEKENLESELIKKCGKNKKIKL